MTSLFAKNFLNILFNVFYILLFARVILSWIPKAADNFLGVFIFEVTEPILAPIRRLLPQSGLDFSPIIAFIALQLIQSLIEKYL
ncbi:MAG: YggT family protein [Patescibacteria group bacterium]|nr:YggT family protein [Patescibacteria group bacterium]